MRVRLADYVVHFLEGKGVRDCFTVVGGGAMHLNDAFGHADQIRCTYTHHEQAAAMAAEAYTRLDNRIAALCVTTGPGGTNAITGVVGGWLDSIPMFVISGQVRYDTTARCAARQIEGLALRAVGDQEFDIVRAVSCMTKYAVMLEDPKDIRRVMEKAWHRAITGRPGPVWVDIPVNYQGMYIETEDLAGYDEALDTELAEGLPPAVSDQIVQDVIDKIRAAKRPVIYAGGGIRISGSFDLFKEVIELLGVPVATYWNSIDVMEDEHPLYVGRGGNMADRAGNFAIQNSDLLLTIGTRNSIRQVGYNWDTWARAAEVIMVDIDKNELKKPTLHVEMPVWADAGDFLRTMKRLLQGQSQPVFSGEWWRAQCRSWKEQYPVLQKRQAEDQDDAVNVYAFVDAISAALPAGSRTAVSNGACCVVGHQEWHIKKDTRFIINSAIASMGYGLPASVGLCRAAGDKETICLEGDGSIMMNLQELQTIITNKLPIKIFLINNRGYHSIRITQNNLFSEHSKVGIGPESGDLSFPEFRKIAQAFGYPYYSARTNAGMREVIDRVLAEEGFAFCEIFTDTKQVWEPKSSARKLPDGSLVSPPLEDLAPFLDREELRKNLFIEPLSDQKN